MRVFDYSLLKEKTWDSEIISLVAQIHEYKGRQEVYLKQKPETLDKLVEIAKRQSTEASNAIEGIRTTSTRLKELCEEKTTPKNRDEEEILGYRDVLNTIHENYEYIPIRTNYILQLHRDLYKYTEKSIGGSFKISQNVIAATDETGKEYVLFTPLAPYETPSAIDAICENYNRMIENQELDTILLIPIFIHDFLCIHPFSDGNGRMSRLLTLLLFYKAGYIVGKYVSMEMLIEKTKETYYEALQASSTGWHEGENSYEPFVKYYLGIMLKAYNEFESRVEHLKYHNLSKPDRIKAVIDNKVGKITKKEIMELCPDISKVTVERTLTDLVKSGYIAKVGAGPSTGYVRI